jgi:putative DNA primase/helicase
MDVLAAFLNECCTIAPTTSASARELYDAYRRWCDENGERWASQKAFGLRLKERGFSSERLGREKVYTWLGVGLARLDDQHGEPPPRPDQGVGQIATDGAAWGVV